MAEINLGTRRICDKCKFTHDFPAGNYKPNDLKLIQNFIGVVGFVATPNGELQPYIQHFCSRKCGIEYLMAEEAMVNAVPKAAGSTEAGNKKDMEYLTALAAGKKAN